MSEPLFRESALEFQRRHGARGDVLHLTPRALFWTHALLAAALAAGLWFAFTGQVEEVATGPAVVRVDGLLELTASRPAVVASVEVDPGEHVQAGQLLLRMHSTGEVAELAAVERELEEQLAKLLRDPADRVARDAMVTLRARRDLSQAALERQTLRAPHAGSVGDLRVRAGQLVEPGMPLVTLQTEASGARVTALVPGRYRPLLSPGSRLRFTAEGFEREVHALTIERIGDQIIGPLEAARLLGRDPSDGLVNGPVVLVHARLAGAGFQSQGERYQFHHGMHGRAETAVRSESIAFTFVPGLRQIADNLL
jgi:membrane fusion protein (multidrug efflux system)